jgi:hypothetical protein
VAADQQRASQAGAVVRQCGDELDVLAADQDVHVVTVGLI